MRITKSVIAASALAASHIAAALAQSALAVALARPTLAVVALRRPQAMARGHRQRPSDSQHHCNADGYPCFDQ